MPHMGALASRTKWDQRALTSLGSGGPWDKARSSVLDPLPLDFFPYQQTHIPAFRGASVGRREGTWPGLGVAGTDAWALPSSGSTALLALFLLAPRDQAGVLKAALVSQSAHWQRQARPWKPHVRAPRPLTLPSVTSRGHTFLSRGHNRHPVCTLLTLESRIQAPTCNTSHRGRQYSLSSPGQGMPGCSGVLGNTGEREREQSVTKRGHGRSHATSG